MRSWLGNGSLALTGGCNHHNKNGGIMTKRQQKAVQATKRANKGKRAAATLAEPVVDVATGQAIYCRLRGYSTAPKAKAGNRTKVSAAYALTIE